MDTLTLPYWLLNGDELEELFLDTEANDHNQRNVFRQAITLNKKKHFQGDPATKQIISFHSPYYFDINEVINYINNRNNERKIKTMNIFGQMRKELSSLTIKMHIGYSKRI